MWPVNWALTPLICGAATRSLPTSFPTPPPPEWCTRTCRYGSAWTRPRKWWTTTNSASVSGTLDKRAATSVWASALMWSHRAWRGLRWPPSRSRSGLIRAARCASSWAAGITGRAWPPPCRSWWPSIWAVLWMTSSSCRATPPPLPSEPAPGAADQRLSAAGRLSARLVTCTTRWWRLPPTIWKRP